MITDQEKQGNKAYCDLVGVHKWNTNDGVNAVEQWAQHEFCRSGEFIIERIGRHAGYVSTAPKFGGQPPN